jgi:hypothetical protein
MHAARALVHRHAGADHSLRALEHQVAASTQNQALAALTFLYDVVLQQPIERVEGIVPARRHRYVPWSCRRGRSACSSPASGRRTPSVPR